MLSTNLKHGTTLIDAIENYNINTEMLNAIINKFPDAILVKQHSNYFGVMSKLANKEFNHIDFNVYGDLWAHPYHKFNLTLSNGTEKEIFVHTNPKKVMLVRRSYTRNGSIISFPLTKKNAKKSKFDQDKLFKDCRLKILEFLKRHDDYKIDTSKADENLIKLLNIT